jgi:hypothetical protein
MNIELTLLKIWVESKVSHLQFLRDTGIGPVTPQSAQDQIKLLRELDDLFNLKDIKIKQNTTHIDVTGKD